MRADEGQAGERQGHVFVYDAALHHALLVGLLMLAHHIHAVYEGCASLREHGRNCAFFASVFAGEHDHSVAFADLGHHSTSGASDTMRMKRFSRSSLPTGPKMRVPCGWFCSFTSTAAFSSNLT